MIQPRTQDLENFTVTGPVSNWDEAEKRISKLERSLRGLKAKQSRRWRWVWALWVGWIVGAAMWAGTWISA